MRTSTVHFGMAGPGMASLIKLAHWGETGCLLAQVLSNSRLVVSTPLDLLLAGEEGQSSQKYNWDGQSMAVCLGKQTLSIVGGGVNTNGRGSFL